MRRMAVSGIASFRQDLRYAARTWRRSPGFALAAVLTLTLAVAANTAVFSLLNAVVLRPLPFPDVSRIVWFLTKTPDGINAGGSHAKFNAWRSLSATFESVSAFAFPSMLLRSGDQFDEVIVGRVTEHFFTLFGARTQVGRTFTSSEESPGGGRVAIISDGMWQRRFGGNDVLGRKLELDHRLYVIVGILAPGFDSRTFTTARYADVEVWLPLVIDPASADLVNHFVIAGRVRPSISLAEAQAQVAAAGEALRRRAPDYFQGTDRATVQPLQSVLARHDRQPLIVLTAAVGLVLLIACANIANLLLSRVADRAPEIATRAALGASRGRIIRQLVTEGLLVGGVAAGSGFVLGRSAIEFVLELTGPTITRIGLTGKGVALDVRVFAFVAVTAVFAVLCFSVTPAVAASKVDLSVRFLGRGATSRRGHLGGLLAATETALAVVVLVAATLLMRTFANLGAVPVGFEAKHLVAVQVTRDAGAQAASDLTRSIQHSSDLVRAIPGVVDVAASVSLPFDQDTDISLRYIIDGRALDGPYHGIGPWRPVGARYFETLHIPILRGRTFTDVDSAHSSPVVVINKAMADKWWPNGDPIGQRMILARGMGGGWDDRPRQIVGVVANVRDESLDQDPVPTNYIPIAQLNAAAAASVLTQVVWIVRTSSDSDSLRPRILDAVQHSSGGMPTVSLGTVSAMAERSRSRAAFRMWLMMGFAGVAVLLAGIGVFGVTAYRVRQRTREIGIRLALGAEAHRVVRDILVESLRFSIAGVAAGAGLAAWATRVLDSLVFGVTPHDPASFVLTCLGMAAIATLAALLPAWRASSLNPIVALRCD